MAVAWSLCDSVTNQLGANLIHYVYALINMPKWAKKRKMIEKSLKYELINLSDLWASASVSKNGYTIVPFEEWKSFISRAVEGSAPSPTNRPGETNQTVTAWSSVKLPFCSFTPSKEARACIWAAGGRGLRVASEVQAAQQASAELWGGGDGLCVLLAGSLHSLEFMVNAPKFL